jgi:hypothetical protein
LMMKRFWVVYDSTSNFISRKTFEYEQDAREEAMRWASRSIGLLDVVYILQPVAAFRKRVVVPDVEEVKLED